MQSGHCGVGGIFSSGCSPVRIFPSDSDLPTHPFVLSLSLDLIDLFLLPSIHGAPRTLAESARKAFMRHLTLLGMLSLEDTRSLIQPHDPEQVQAVCNRLIRPLGLDIERTVWELGPCVMDS